MPFSIFQATHRRQLIRCSFLVFAYFLFYYCSILHLTNAIFNFSGNPQSTDASTSSINWDAIQHAVKTVVTSPSAPSAPNSAAPLPSSSPSPSLEDSGKVTKLLGYVCQKELVHGIGKEFTLFFLEYFNIKE